MTIGQTATCRHAGPAGSSNNTTSCKATTEKVRNKYNTLTPAEIKKITKSLFQGNTSQATPSSAQKPHQQANLNSNAAQLYGTLRHVPMRTASVLHKPRAPPIIVTDLDTTIDQLERNNSLMQNTHYHSPNGSANNDSSPQQALGRSASIRSATGVSYDNRRHTVNYGRLSSTMNSRASLYSTNSSSTATTANQRRSVIYDLKQQDQHQMSPNESFSNLSFKSSFDTTDCASQATPADDPYRLQTMSVDLGSQQHYNNGNNNYNKQPRYDPMMRGRTIARIKYNTLTSASSKMFTGDSYSSSTQSNVSASTLRPSSATPTKFSASGSVSSNIKISGINQTKQQPPRSASKSSLSASTYKVFQSPLANIKRLFRNMPRPFASNQQQQAEQELDSKHDTSAHCFDTNSIDFRTMSGSGSHNCHQDQSLGDLSISDSISQISLNKSQSPPAICPPPPGELKSMCYMESAVNYSNYDDFTRSRNERMAQRQQTLKDGLAAASQEQQQRQQLADCANNSDAWQLTSLPVYYERNLTTVFEEKQASCEFNDKILAAQNAGIFDAGNVNNVAQQDLIRPPVEFDESGDMTLTNDDIDKMGQQQQQPQRKSSTEGSMLSLNSCTTTGSSHINQPQPQPQPQPLTPAKPYRFSFAQPLQPPHEPCVVDQVSFQKNLGLPPRTPTSNAIDQRLSINTSETTKAATTVAVGRRDNSSSGNSSNCSSQLNGINNCDRPNSPDASDKSSYNSNEDSNSLSASSSTNNHHHLDHLGTTCSSGYGNLNGLADSSNEADVTLLSETSTLQGCTETAAATGIGYYANKCSELERTVKTLKNKLVSKEKELTDLQLNQLNNDYAIERLKKRLSQLERENGQLKAAVVAATTTNQSC